MPTPLSETTLSGRAYRRLRLAGAEHLEDLQGWTEERLLALDGFGLNCLREVTELLAERGLALAPSKRRERVPRKLAGHETEIARRYTQKRESPRQLANAYGVTHQSIRLCLLRNGVKLRTRDEGDAERQRARPDQAAENILLNYLTAADAADLLGISRFTMHEYLQDGRLPGAFQIGKRSRFWLVPRAAVEARKKARER